MEVGLWMGKGVNNLPIPTKPRMPTYSTLGVSPWGITFTDERETTQTTS